LADEDVGSLVAVQPVIGSAPNKSVVIVQTIKVLTREAITCSGAVDFNVSSGCDGVLFGQRPELS
jgi:hypothetical protein